ncbi:MAG TPA: hypothetical protein DEB33_09040 [Gemmatimonadetes bacterium]|jgi:hypothetical protein|nr:hypothetical protein [Gemmatimonadota bacterium]HCW78373.1 hypothetical protein [Gemmatimonadota bacterium]|tara:strand:- start:800 stop:1084 length:285 start_codon:yes stop_codon:yes gene_type:complete
MFGLIATVIAGTAGVLVHMKSRYFVRKRLRYTSVVDKPMLGVWVGIGTTIVVAPIVAVLPIVGAGTAIAVGIGVGTGVAMGVKDSKRSTKFLED